jgi:hypothetical protein
MLEELEKLRNRTSLSKWSLVSVALMYVFTLLVIEKLLSDFVGDYVQTNYEQKRWLFFVLITIANLVFPILIWKSADMHYKKKSAAVKNFCNTSINFSKDYDEYVVIEKPVDAKYKKSNLWYLFINTKNFDQCKSTITAHLQKIRSDRNPDNTISDVEMWSLLGASELLIKFRSSVNLAQQIEKDLLSILGPPKLVNDSWFDENYQAVETSMLESTHKNRRGMQLINCTYERVLNKNGHYNFDVGRLRYIRNVDYKTRSMKTFIKFHFDKNNNYDEGKIRDVLPYFKDTVELMATCENQNSNELKFIIIEAHYPCGKFSDLFRLSEELESCLESNVVKETYIAYSGGLLFQDTKQQSVDNAKQS